MLTRDTCITSSRALTWPSCFVQQVIFDGSCRWLPLAVVEGNKVRGMEENEWSVIGLWEMQIGQLMIGHAVSCLLFFFFSFRLQVCAVCLSRWWTVQVMLFEEGEGEPILLILNSSSKWADAVGWVDLCPNRLTQSYCKLYSHWQMSSSLHCQRFWCFCMYQRSFV